MRETLSMKQARTRHSVAAIPRIAAVLAAAAALLSAASLLAACGEERRPPAGTLSTREVLPKIGVALGGGGARGFSEIGVLRVLEQEKIPIDVVAGTSVGSLIGAIYCDSGRSLDAEFLAVSIEEEDLFDYGLFSIFSGGFVKGDKLEAFLNGHLKHKSIETLAVPFAAAAVDLRTGKVFVFESGPVARAVHASAAIPGVFVPVTIGEATYVDGGVVDPVPVDVARGKGAEVVIAVSIPPNVPKEAPSNPLEIAYHSVTIMSAEIADLRSKEADVVVTPDVGDVRYDDFTQKKRLIEAGENAAREALPAIRIAIRAKTHRLPVN
jgi:NTE family protein